MKTTSYPNPNLSSDPLASQCKALHMQAGRLLLLASLPDIDKRSFVSIKNELSKLKSCITKLEDTISLEEQKHACPQQLSLLP